ncbi:MAG TPA: hypothetical protein VNU70_09395, partial [Puia sp.]|nr:hypothetical protein [Puia sp.]
IGACIHFVAPSDHQPTTSGHQLTAAASVFDPSALKQNTVIHYPQTTALALGGLRILSPFLNLPPIPRKNEPLKILYIKYLGFAAGRERQLHDLLCRIRHYAFLHKYHLVSVAVDAKDASLKSIVRPLSRFVFRSIGLMTSLQDHMPLVGDISRGILYEDFSLV